MPDQSAQAIIRYATASGISQLELMGAPVENFLGRPSTGRGGGGGRAGGGGRGRGNDAPPTPEELAAQRAAAEELRKWRLSVPMSKVAELRKMFDDAGVSIYAVKSLSTNMSDDEVDWAFQIGKALGASHLTLELTEDVGQLKRLGDVALKHQMTVAYHTHGQGNMTAFDAAFAASKGNRSNIDFGHYVNAGSGDPVLFLEKFHERIASFHVKDRTAPGTSRPWRHEPALGPGRHADREHPPHGAAQQVDDAGDDRARVPGARGLERRARSRQVPQLLPGRARIAPAASD
jgi:sugar phosphate isomerase/epimerase